MILMRNQRRIRSVEKTDDIVSFCKILKASASKGYVLRVYHPDPVVLHNLKNLLIDACVELDMNIDNDVGQYEMV